jgi:hypothetical protein
MTVGASAMTRTFLVTPLGTQDINEIITFKTRRPRCCWNRSRGWSRLVPERETERRALWRVGGLIGELCAEKMMAAALAGTQS